MNQNCKVCGEVAAGYHFGAFTCEGCKSFFGRTYNNRSSIGECKNNNQCVINKKNRTSCKSCRLQKCFNVGMSKSGSRYGRRSNWFKIHCLLADQQQTTPQHQLQQQQPLQQQQQMSQTQTPTQTPTQLQQQHPPQTHSPTTNLLLAAQQQHHLQTNGINLQALTAHLNSQHLLQLQAQQQQQHQTNGPTNGHNSNSNNSSNSSSSTNGNANNSINDLSTGSAAEFLSSLYAAQDLRYARHLPDQLQQQAALAAAVAALSSQAHPQAGQLQQNGTSSNIDNLESNNTNSNNNNNTNNNNNNNNSAISVSSGGHSANGNGSPIASSNANQNSRDPTNAVAADAQMSNVYASALAQFVTFCYLMNQQERG